METTYSSSTRPSDHVKSNLLTNKNCASRSAVIPLSWTHFSLIYTLIEHFLVIHYLETTLNMLKVTKNSNFYSQMVGMKQCVYYIHGICLNWLPVSQCRQISWWNKYCLLHFSHVAPMNFLFVVLRTLRVSGHNIEVQCRTCSYTGFKPQFPNHML